MKRFVIFSDVLGIYLGSMMGLGFWSKLDPCGQPEAVTFASEAEARAWMKSWDTPPPEDVRCVEVEVVRRATRAGSYATIDECAAAGLPRWDPDAVLESNVTLN